MNPPTIIKKLSTNIVVDCGIIHTIGLFGKDVLIKFKKLGRQLLGSFFANMATFPTQTDVVPWAQIAPFRRNNGPTLRKKCIAPLSAEFSKMCVMTFCAKSLCEGDSENIVLFSVLMDGVSSERPKLFI